MLVLQGPTGRQRAVRHLGKPREELRVRAVASLRTVPLRRSCGLVGGSFLTPWWGHASFSVPPLLKDPEVVSIAGWF